MQKEDRAKAEQAMQDALAKGEDQSWSNSQTGASGNIEMVDQRTVELAREQGVALPLATGGSLQLKGFTLPVASFQLLSA